MKRTPDPTTKIDKTHAKNVAPSPHNREQLRRKLLKMILQNEAQRRGLTVKPHAVAESMAELAVFDPDDRLGQELAAASPGPKRA
jgi:hypothetical protein